MNNMEIYRKEKQLTLSQLANITGISVGYLCHLEKGTRSNPSKKLMEKIAIVLNKTVTEVFKI